MDDLDRDFGWLQKTLAIIIAVLSVALLIAQAIIISMRQPSG